MTKTAKLFRIGNSQAVRLPREFRFKGDEVRIRKVGDTLVLKPIITNVKEWLAEIDRHPLGADAFQGDWRKQLKAPKRSISGLHCVDWTK